MLNLKMLKPTRAEEEHVDPEVAAEGFEDLQGDPPGGEEGLSLHGLRRVHQEDHLIGGRRGLHLKVRIEHQHAGLEDTPTHLFYKYSVGSAPLLTEDQRDAPGCPCRGVSPPTSWAGAPQTE